MFIDIYLLCGLFTEYAFVFIIVTSKDCHMCDELQSNFASFMLLCFCFSSFRIQLLLMVVV